MEGVCVDFNPIKRICADVDPEPNVCAKTCGKCGKGFSTYNSCYQHCKLNRKCGSFPLKTCSKCNHKYRDPREVKRHKCVLRERTSDYEHVDGKLKCLKCDQLCRNLGAMRNHEKKEHGKQFPLKCGYCDKTFVTKREVKSHEEFKHTLQKTFLCQHCSYSCKTQKCLDNHVNAKHEYNVKYTCNECGFMTFNPVTLRAHEISKHGMHQKAKLYCSHCPYSTYIKGALVQHVRIHTGDKPYECTQCDAKFPQKKGLDEHIACNHTFEKKYKCSICNWSSAFSGALSDHLKNRHTDKGIIFQKRKEERVLLFLNENNISFEREKLIQFNCLDSSGSRARIDFVIPKPWGYILLEVDEDQHKFYDYQVSCEVRRMADVVGAIRTNDDCKLLFIRYNPDSFSVDGCKRKISVALRECKLLEIIQDYEPKQDVAILYLFYDTVDGLLTFFYDHSFQPLRELVLPNEF